MQAVSQPPTPTTHSGAVGLQISTEWVLYGLLVLFVLVVRVADLDIVPMSDVEATRALAAWHFVVPDAPGTPQAADSPIVFWLQAIGFSFLGGTEFAARLGGVLGGVILTLMPLLFRLRFGREFTFGWSLLLGLSAVPFIAARTSDPALWSAIFALGLLWALWQHHDTRQWHHALWAAAFAAGLLLSGSGGLVLAVSLLLSALLNLWWLIAKAPEERDTPGDDLVQASGEWLRSLPLQAMLATLAFTVFVVSTGFFLYPTGLSITANALSGALTGLLQASQPDAPFAHGLIALIVYEPILLILGGMGVGLLFMQRETSVASRFARIWSLVGLMLLLLYRGATPGDALWVVLPITWIVAYLAQAAVRDIEAPVFIFDDYFADSSRFWWAKWVLGVIVLALLIMLTLHLQEVGRGLLEVPPNSSASILLDARFQTARGSALMVIFVVLLTVVGFFLAASFWGNAITAQGYAVGGLLFLLVTGVSMGWSVAVANADNPAEIWHVSAISPDAYLMRETISDIADRDTLGFSELGINVLLDDNNTITDDGLIAWLLRDYENARFTGSLETLAREEIVILPASEVEPDLGGSYIGQSFVLRRTLSDGLTRGLDFPAWILQRRLRGEGWAEETAVVWLRLDVYDGVPPDNRINR